MQCNKTRLLLYHYRTIMAFTKYVYYGAFKASNQNSPWTILFSVNCIKTFHFPRIAFEKHIREYILGNRY